MKGLTLVTLCLLAAASSYAHILPGDATGFLSGVVHPIHGLDHLLAMLAVGLWAAQMGGQAVWTVPTSFVGVMTFGGVLGMNGIGVPFVEQGILASVFLLGLMILFAARLPTWASVALVGIFALFHGHAHGTEIPASATGLEYALGFAMTTAVLHLGGIGLGLLAQKLGKPSEIRWAGAAIIVGGFCLLV